MKSDYAVARDPLFLAAAGVFAVLTTALPAVFGQTLLLTLLQTVTLTALLAVALRTGSSKAAVWTLAIWVLTQTTLIVLLTFYFGERTRIVIRNGFDVSTSMVAWLYTESPLPYSLQTTPGDRFLELTGILLGSLLTGGLVGVWFLMEAVNQTAFIVGVLLSSLAEGVRFPVALMPWSVLRIAGYIGFVALLAEPLWTGSWSPLRLWNQHRMLIALSAALLILALLLESFLPGGWRGLFV